MRHSLPDRYRHLRSLGMFFGTLARAAELRQKRAQSRHLPQKTPAERLASARIVVRLGGESAREVSNLCHAMRPRVQRWTSAQAISDRSPRRIREIDHGRYSCRCKWRKIDYAPQVTSYALVCASGRSIVYRYDQSSTRLIAPRGWQWEKDANGLRLVRIGRPDCDYHPDSDDLRHYSGRALARKAREAYGQRRRAA